MKNITLPINEMFYSIQGEGATIGRPALFIRFFGCNLKCSFCDSKHSWSGAEVTPMVFEEVCKTIEDHYPKKFAIVITGGEPLLYADKVVAFIDFVRKHYDNITHFEIETNGTIVPPIELLFKKDIKFNVSPKLSNSGEDHSKRVNIEAMKVFTDAKAIFKFVTRQYGDLEEAFRLFNYCGIKIPHEQIYLMPEGKNRAEIAQHQASVVELALDYGVNYSPRTHIDLFGGKRGV